MAVTIDCDPSLKEMALDDYIDWVHANVKSEDAESVKESAPMLSALAHNRHMLIDAICDSLKRSATSLQEENFYTGVVFVLYDSARDRDIRRRKAGFAVRMVVWRAPRLWAGDLRIDNKVQSYDLAHDHNFDFLTVGYHGPGYRTDIYEYDASKVEGYIGEHIDLNFLEHTALPTGKVMFYRKNADIHTQKSPEQTSISLNLLLPADAVGRRKVTHQYKFDLEDQCIAGYLSGPVNNGVSLLELAEAMGDENTGDVIAHIARNSPHPRIRAAAYKAYAKILPSERELIKAQLLNDPSSVVRHVEI